MNNDSTVPDTDVVVIVETDETNIVSPSNINSNLRENVEETSIVPTLVTSINLKDPAIWPISITKSVCNRIICCLPIENCLLVDYIKYLLKDIYGKYFTNFIFIRAIALLFPPWLLHCL